jgi:hypothetical protein
MGVSSVDMISSLNAGTQNISLTDEKLLERMEKTTLTDNLPQFIA